MVLLQLACVVSPLQYGTTQDHFLSERITALCPAQRLEWNQRLQGEGVVTGWDSNEGSDWFTGQFPVKDFLLQCDAWLPKHQLVYRGSSESRVAVGDLQ